MATDPDLVEFFEVNFPEAFHEAQTGAKDGDRLATSHRKIDKKVESRYPRNIRPMQTYLRDVETEEGSRACRRLRWKNMIPGTIRGSDPNLGIFSKQPESEIYVKTPWAVLQRELDRYHRDFESRVYDITVLDGPEDTEGTTHRVLPQNLQRHPVNSTIYCANFCRYHPGRPIKFPVSFINTEESPALKRDGFIIPIQRSIECFVEDDVDIPESLDMECSGLQFKDVIRTDRIILPDGVRFSDRVIKRGKEFIVGVMFGSGRGLEEDTTETEKEPVAEK